MNKLTYQIEKRIFVLSQTPTGLDRGNTRQQE